MLAQYSSNSGVSEGLRQTFDGEHPCSLCLAIEQAKEENPEDEGPANTSERRPLPEMNLPVNASVANPAGSDLAPCDTPWKAELHGLGRQRPVLPPPRMA